MLHRLLTLTMYGGPNSKKTTRSAPLPHGDELDAGSLPGHKWGRVAVARVSRPAEACTTAEPRIERSFTVSGNALTQFSGPNPGG
jgi:hypothetical protein